MSIETPDHSSTEHSSEDPTWLEFLEPDAKTGTVCLRQAEESGKNRLAGWTRICGITAAGRSHCKARRDAGGPSAGMPDAIAISDGSQSSCQPASDQLSSDYQTRAPKPSKTPGFFARFLCSFVLVGLAGNMHHNIFTAIKPSDLATAPRMVPSTEGQHTRPTPAAGPQHDTDFGPYMEYMQKTVQLAWFPPRGQEPRAVVVLFKWHDDGSISDLRLDKSSGSVAADRAALSAVEDAAPFPSFPIGAPDDVDIQLGFNCLVEERYPQHNL